MAPTVLLIEDELILSEVIKDFFENDGYSVLTAQDGKEGLQSFCDHKVDIVILDIMMPETDGWSVCRRIRKHSDVPVIIVTARDEDEDTLLGFELGADDYVTKPFNPSILVARAKALLKRGKSSSKKESLLEIEGIEIDFSSRTLKVDGKEIRLTHTEFEILSYLMMNRGRVMKREAIADHVWNYDFFGDDRAINTHISNLRNKIGDKGKYIQTIIRSGYIFEVSK
ncbi:response regulator transcription factor [Pseudalkalibacillus sp. R45]|uniref:response regulator transcription factor n=1 Tax=Pseudalkalibacillus sp. R45 TaxID=3457433 RepID=UPI003FCE0805